MYFQHFFKFIVSLKYYFIFLIYFFSILFSYTKFQSKQSNDIYEKNLEIILIFWNYIHYFDSKKSTSYNIYHFFEKINAKQILYQIEKRDLNSDNEKIQLKKIKPRVLLDNQIYKLKTLNFRSFAAPRRRQVAASLSH